MGDAVVMALRFPLAKPRHSVMAPAGEAAAPPDPARDWAEMLLRADSACCCPARPLFVAMLPPAPGRLEPVDLLLCGHHYRAARTALAAAGAIVFDATGAIVTGDWPPRE